MADKRSPDMFPHELQHAVDCMEDALGFLDDHGAPKEIGAHLDLAICQLRDYLGYPDSKTVPKRPLVKR